MRLYLIKGSPRDYCAVFFPCLSVRLYRYDFPWGWPIALVYGSITYDPWTWTTKDFFGPVLARMGGVRSPNSIVFRISRFFESRLLKVYKYTKYDLRHNNTVGNRVDEIRGSDSSKFCFWTFYSIINTPTKKKLQHEIPCYSPVLRYLSAKSKLWRNCTVGTFHKKGQTKIFLVIFSSFLVKTVF